MCRSRSTGCCLSAIGLEYSTKMLAFSNNVYTCIQTLVATSNGVGLLHPGVGFQKRHCLPPPPSSLFCAVNQRFFFPRGLFLPLMSHHSTSVLTSENTREKSRRYINHRKKKLTKKQRRPLEHRGRASFDTRN